MRSGQEVPFGLLRTRKVTGREKSKWLRVGQNLKKDEIIQSVWGYQEEGKRRDVSRPWLKTIQSRSDRGSRCCSSWLTRQIKDYSGGFTVSWFGINNTDRILVTFNFKCVIVSVHLWDSRGEISQSWSVMIRRLLYRTWAHVPGVRIEDRRGGVKPLKIDTNGELTANYSQLRLRCKNQWHLRGTQAVWFLPFRRIGSGLEEVSNVEFDPFHSQPGFVFCVSSSLKG